jgi:small-conductance mechanosensitive channel
MYAFKRKMDTPSSILPSFSSAVVDPFSAQRVGTSSAAASSSAIDMQLILMIISWYACAVVTITSTKELMIRVPLPFLLCLSQFAFATVLSFAYLKYTDKLKFVPSTARSVIMQIALSYTLGFVLTNIAFSLGM